MTSRAGTGGTRRDTQIHQSRSSAARGELEHVAEVAPGVAVTWDPARPRHRVGVVASKGGDSDAAASVADVDRLPWLRLAAVAVLDRRLYAPLDQSLLDAEVAAAQLAAARTLGGAEPVREFLVGRALVGARAASQGVVAHMARLAADDRRPPAALAAALGTVARCYAALSAEVREFDASLAAVTEAWHRLTSIERTGSRDRPLVDPPAVARQTRRGAAQIDPRSVPARVLRFGPTSDAAEISVDAVRGQAGPAVQVRVDAFSSAPSADEAVDVGIRAIDRRSGEVRGYGLLGRSAARRPTMAPGEEGRRHFEGLVSLPPSLSAADVRVDLFDMSGAPPPVSANSSELRRVRRATLFLSEWRALVADVRLWGVRTAPAARLRAILRRLAGDHSDGADIPLWSGGPTRSHLVSLVELGDRTLAGRLRRGRVRGEITAIPGDDGGAAAVVAAVAGPGDLLVAEVAAAHERSWPRRRS
jgi:hypothetical protein